MQNEGTMQAFDRTEEESPAWLRSADAQRSRQQMVDFMLAERVKRGQTTAPLSSLSLEDSTVFEALNRLFRGKCAFCEAQDQVTAYRFRPQQEALPSQSADISHLYYMWLADAWENIYPICRSCQPAEPAYFPVQGKRSALPNKTQLQRYVDDPRGIFWRNEAPAERTLLLDPCRYNTDFSRMLVPRL